jgi:hypothetical protein
VQKISPSSNTNHQSPISNLKSKILNLPSDYQSGDYLTFSRKQYNPAHVEKNSPFAENPAWPGSIGAARHCFVFRSPGSFQACLAIGQPAIEHY